ncbi:MAG: hypothetical protein Q4Q19_03520 [Methanobrevibacter sp.]|nr:hypothetical protein [Methanobrevibacter sp.]
MSDDLYSNLLRATDNTADITTEKQGTITKIQDKLCNVKEEATGLEHTNVPVINEVQVKEGDTVLLGFLDNNIYNPVVYGVIGRETVDEELSSTSKKPVQNKTITNALNDKAGLNHTHLSEQILDLIDVIYPIGSIYMSVNNVNPASLFGGEWEQIKDKFLLSSGDVYSNQSEGGSADAVVVKHNHTQNSHNHTQNSHGHLPSGGDSRRFMSSPNGCGWSELAGANVSGSGYYYVATNSTSHNVYNEGIGTTVATNQAATATNKEAGVDGTGKNLPPYLAVNVWKRTA